MSEVPLYTESERQVTDNFAHPNCEDPRPVTCNPSRAVTLPNIGVPLYIGVPHRVAYPYKPSQVNYVEPCLCPLSAPPSLSSSLSPARSLALSLSLSLSRALSRALSLSPSLRERTNPLNPNPNPKPQTRPWPRSKCGRTLTLTVAKHKIQHKIVGRRRPLTNPKTLNPAKHHT